MTRNHFSKKGGPYFVGQTFSQHKEIQEKIDKEGLAIVSTIGKIRSLFKFPRFGRKK